MIKKKLGLTLSDKKVKNRIVREMFDRCVNSKPSPIYNKKFIDRIKLGNLNDDLPLISNCDWIIEVVTEKIEIKKIVFDQIEKHRKKGSLVTSNTSGIPIKFMNENRSEDFENTLQSLIFLTLQDI